MISNIDSSKQLKLGAIMSYLAIAFNIISGLLYTPWMVDIIGKEDYGLYILATSLIGFFAMDFGLGSAISRFLSKYKAMGDLEGQKRFLGITYKLFIIITALVFIVLVIVYFLMENIFVELTAKEIEKLEIIFLISGIFTISSFPFKPFDGILIANERFIFIKLADLVHKILIVFLMVLALLMGYGLYAIVIVNALVGLLIVLIKYFYIKNTTDTEVDIYYSDRKLYKQIFGYSVWTTIIAVGQRFILNITPSILGAFAGSVQIALFSLGMVIEGYTWSISNALGGLFLPKVTRMTTNNNDMREVENLLIKVGRIQLLIIGLIIAGFASMGQEFIRLWMGESFSDSYYIALLLIAPGLITLTQEIAYTTLIALNEIRYRAIASLITAVISTVISIILSQHYGAIGSASAIFIGNILGLVIFMNIVYYKVLKINIFRFFKECHYKIIIPLILTIFIGLIIQYIFPVSSLVIFMLKASVFVLIYFILMWFISLNEYEKNLFSGVFKKILERK